MSSILENKEVLSVNILHSDFQPLGKSFTYIKNNKGAKPESRGTPASILVHFDIRPLRRTRC